MPDRTDFPKAFAELADVAERSQHIVNEWLTRNRLVEAAPSTSPAEFANLFLQLTTKIMVLPASMVSAQMSLWQDYFTLWQNTTSRMLGHAMPTASEVPQAVDLFPADWRDVDVFTYLKQSYLLTAYWAQETLAGAGQPDASIRDTMDFCARQFMSALTPMNFALTNPEVIRATSETHGENLVNGLKNLLSAMEPTEGRERTGLTGSDPFVVGETVAATAGKVVFRNDLMELIQYAPRTEQVCRPPLLFVPPWTNRFYLFDLRESSSLVRWAADHGHTVFVLSWADPDPEQARPTFEDYVLSGPIAALAAIEQATGEAKVNAVGFGLGGTLLAATLAYLAEGDENLIRSATFLASLWDFSEPGELGALIDEAAICQLEEAPEHGLVDPRDLARTCTLQRETDLLWSFVVNNYLLGRDPFPADLLRWNRDVLRLPFAAHAFYLRHLYRQNRLAEPGGVRIGERALDLHRVDVPTYVLAAREDHIAPWQSAYKSAALLNGEKRFTLAASGHLAGVFNPPHGNRYCYWTNPHQSRHAEDWRAGARSTEGSWWPDWDRWLHRQCGSETVAARRPGSRSMPPIADAPGEYVRAA